MKPIWWDDDIPFKNMKRFSKEKLQKLLKSYKSFLTAQDISNPAHDNIRDRSPLASPVHKIHSPTSSQICPQNFPANNFSSYATLIKIMLL